MGDAAGDIPPSSKEHSSELGRRIKSKGGSCVFPAHQKLLRAWAKPGDFICCSAMSFVKGTGFVAVCLCTGMSCSYCQGKWNLGSFECVSDSRWIQGNPLPGKRFLFHTACYELWWIISCLLSNSCKIAFVTKKRGTKKPSYEWKVSLSIFFFLSWHIRGSSKSFQILHLWEQGLF